jgi:hypothetical protein
MTTPVAVRMTEGEDDADAAIHTEHDIPDQIMKSSV